MVPETNIMAATTPQKRRSKNFPTTPLTSAAFSGVLVTKITRFLAIYVILQAGTTVLRGVPAERVAPSESNA